MTRHDNGKAIARTERSGSALCPRTTREPRQVAVRNDLSVRHAPKSTDDVQLEGRPALELELDIVERHRLASEVGPESVDQFLRIRHSPVSHASALRRYRRPRGWWGIPPT